MLLTDLFDEYALYLRVGNKSPHSIATAGYHLRRFGDFLETRGCPATTEEVTSRLVREFISELQSRYAPGTVAANVRVLKTLFAFGFREGIIDADPLERIPTPRLPKQDVESFEPEEVEQLLRACDRNTLIGMRDFVIITVLYDSGIRASELVGLSDDSIDWNRALLRVLGKGAKERHVPISARTLRAIRRYISQRNKAGFDAGDALFVTQSGQPFSRYTLAQLMKRLEKRTGLQVHPHKFRHSFAVNALRNGAREFDIQGCLGHSSLEMTRHYARQTAEDLAREHKRFSPVDRLRVRI